MSEYYEIRGPNPVVRDDIVFGEGSIIEGATLDKQELSRLIADGVLVPYGTDTGKTPPKEPHPERVEQDITHKVIEPTVKKGKGK